MKKSLVMAMALAMGVTASAYAANPFTDVPAGHWAYDAVAQLAANGVVEGYGTTFGGDKLMTRYEMAQIVAKAMAKGANCEKLAAEFADELDTLGVRVAKLEKKVDNVKLTGQVRAMYRDHNGKGHDNSVGKLRTRIFVNGAINDNWSYTGMLQNEREILSNDDNDGNDDVKLTRAYLTGRIGGLKVTAGRWNEFFINDTILDEYIDAVQATYDFEGYKFLALAGKYSHNAYGHHNWKGYDGTTKGNGVDADDTANRLYIAGVTKQIKAVNMAFNWFNSEDGYGKRNIYNVNADWAIDKNWGLTGRYMWTDERIAGGSKDGWFGQLNYKGADTAKVGSWGARARYFDQPLNVYISPTYDFYSYDAADGGYDGWNLGADFTLAKNILLQVDYYDTQAKKGSNEDRCWYSQVCFFF